MARKVWVPKRFQVVSKDDEVQYTRKVFQRSYELVYGPRGNGGYVTVDVDWYEEDGRKWVDPDCISFGVMSEDVARSLREWVLRDLRKDRINPVWSS